MLEGWLAGHGGSRGGVGVGGGRRGGEYGGGGHFGGRDLRSYLSLSRMEEEFFQETNMSGFVTLRRRGVDGPRRRPLRPTSLPVVSTTCPSSQGSPPESGSTQTHSLARWKYEVSSICQMALLHLSDGRTHNGEGGGGGTEGGGGGGGGGGRADEEELGAFWELLDTELRPIQPVRSCPESLSIFSEHKEMARKYLVLQQEIFNLRKHKSVLEEKLSQAEKLEHLGNQRYQDKIRELENKRENLRHTHTKLRQQLEQIRMRQEEQQQSQNHQEDGSGDGIGHNHPLSPP